MKYLIFFFFPSVCIAAEEINFESWYAMLTKIIDNSTAIGGVFGGIILCLGLLTMSLFIIAWTSWAKNKREKEAYDNELKTAKMLAENTAKMQKDTAIMQINALDTLWKKQYESFIDKIKNKKYSEVYPKIDKSEWEKIAKFLYNEEITAEQRAAMIIIEIRKENV